MIRLTRFSLPLTLAAFLVSSLTAVELSYQFQGGENFTYLIENEAKVPTQGTMVSKLQYSFLVAEANDPSSMEVSVSGESTAFEFGYSEASFDLGSNGQASNLDSDNLNHPVDGAFVKNAPGFFFPLPGGDIQVNDSWQARTVLYFPKMDVPGAFTQLKTNTTFQYAGTRQAADGRTLHVLKTKAVHVPGSKQKVSFTGEGLFDAEAGRLTAMTMAGVVKVKVGFISVKVPTSLTLVEAAPNL